MKLIDRVKDIREAIEKNKLVIFVGSGVSRNSGIPTWSGLIKEFAKKLNYDKCEFCNDKKKGCKSKECLQRYQFTQDEFLKIPQYYYNKDKSKGHKRYYELISDTLKSDNKANPLNDIIIRLLPKHIITTNYDKLLENSKDANVMLYDIIIDDKDLLTHSSNNYIIKMHGDIDRPETIVLKEDDYINYQQEHTLIETFIKSLLIDHTFLFIGYSLNDYNLKLIMGWIQYFAKEHYVSDLRPKNYIVLPEKAHIKKHIEKYFEHNNIFILNPYDLPSEIKHISRDIGLYDQGKKVYAMLDYIYDDKNDYLLETLPKTLVERYKIFDPFKRISFEDLLNVYNFGHANNIGGNLYFYNEEDFNKLKSMVLSTGELEKIIKKTFLKAGITAIQHREEFLTFENENENEQTIDDELFNLYLNNEYLKIIARLNSIEDDNLVAYYYYLLTPHMGNLNIKLNEIERDIALKNNTYQFIIYKYNRILFKQSTFQDTKKDWIEFENILDNIQKQYKKAYSFIEKLSRFGMSNNLLKSNNLFEKHKDKYLKTSNSISFDSGLSQLLELRSIAYDYYYYMKYNNIMLDYFINTKTYFQSYIKAILCTYAPNKSFSTENIFGFYQRLDEYRINEIDFDMLIKYTDNKLLKVWATDYKIKKIHFNESVNISYKFENMCKSMKILGHRYNNEQLLNFIFIITKCDLSEKEKYKVIESLSMLIERNENKVNEIMIDLFDGIEELINFYQDENITLFYNILFTLLHNETIKLINESFNKRLSRVFKKLTKYSNKCVQNIVDSLIELQEIIPEKLEMIHTLHYLFTDTQKIQYMRIVKDNVEMVSSEDLFTYIIDKYVSIDDDIREQFIKIIEREYEIRKVNPGVRTFPDLLKSTIEICLILHLLNIWDNISSLSKFKSCSDCLEFILDPQNFDYSKIDTSYYMWQNIFRNKHYSDIILSHKNDIVDKLKIAADFGYATESQKKILYKYILSEDELWNL